MRTLELLSGPAFWPGVVAALALGLLGGALGVLVVLRRMAFVGQGVSHAAFGAVGLAAFLGVARHSLGRWTLVVLFCTASALGIGWLRRRGSGSADTAIGVVLVGAMALGAILMSASPGRAPGWESLLFGSISAVGWADAALAWAVCVATLLTLAWIRRPLLFWAFDESSAETFGVPTTRVEHVLLVLLAVAVVTAMKLAGVVLATALLVLPAATALRLSDRLGPVFALSAGASVAGVLGGVVLSFETDWPTGASIVAAQVTILGIAWGVAAWTRGLARRRHTGD